MAADSHLPGILRLNPEFRHRIYLDVGLGQTPCHEWTYPEVYHLGRPSQLDEVDPRTEEDPGPEAFHGLLLSCRTIYLEASALLYSENWFIIHYQPRRSLSSLRALTPHALASLTNLKIVLNQAACHAPNSGDWGDGACCERVWSYKPGQDKSKEADPKLLHGCLNAHDHDSALDGSSKLAEEVLAEWQTTAAYLAPHLRPGKLELFLVCDVGHREVDLARRVLDGLHILPRLKDCHVRLCETRNSQLQHLVQDAVLQARGIISSVPLTSSGRPGPLNPPSLLNLPPEIRLRILEYTDLTTPDKEVMWHRKLCGSGYYIHRPPCNAPYGFGFCVPDCGGTCQFSHCWRVSWPQPSIGCFCRRRHSAYSSRCKCWAPPTPLFLVCATLYREAQLVFYSRNRFIIVDSPYTNLWVPWEYGDYPFKSFAATQFLRHVIPQHCLGYLRFLELTFSQFTHLGRPRDDHPALRDWDEGVEWLKGKLNLRVLTLRMVMAGNPDPGRGYRGSYEMTPDQAKEIMATYNRILLPLQLLGTAPGGGLARFCAELPWPLKWSGWARDRVEDGKFLEWLASKDAEIKRRAEKFVMGDRYESVSLSGVEPQMSAWWWGRETL
ncbi:hypothetical protein B0I37DRAFT_373964 [Chaetomium sp. MPI-CAGE-AT-0009]|nr:hypothetical protein B0I37DRAFT_373964 [Chaetomium sp. MPI-CAGE-AT-0009]